jgi:YHS domain-containing protein
MTKIISFVMIGLVVCILAGYGTVFGMSCGSDMSGSHAPESAKPADSSKAVDAGNKICPVLGEPIDEANKATYEYKSKIYNFCCAGCIETFKKDPQKYIKKVDKELKAESKMSGSMQSGHHHGH